MSSVQESVDEQQQSQARRIAEQRAHEDIYAVASGSITVRRKELVHHIENTLIRDRESAFLSDMIIECQNIEFPCHKAIVCAQSPTIRACVQKAPVRARRCRIKIKCHPLVFRMAIEFLYTCNYDFFMDFGFPSRFMAKGQTVSADPIDRLDCCELSLHLQVHVLAQRLRIRALKFYTVNRIVSVLQRTSFPTVYPRFVREVYWTIKEKDTLVKRVVTAHADRVTRQLRDRNHFDARFPLYLLREIEEFGVDFLAWMPDWDDPLNGDCSSGTLAPTHWYC
ncbi:BTB/POZ domain-containing protein [Aspergillus foveolatus]|uniref:BTB/POZ domain-containing protein n=1 Tax=Aspergillus foveolatus TaxID=210207 RepID=UPI003CCCBC01